ncbi:MAG TPA: hypothetical protein VEJ18_20470 [Planctomycetota bacterium]|nr:hypothetical protein [Planctomycetota bacterium]
MRSTLSLLLALALSLPALAQVKGPAEVVAPIGRLVSIPLTIDADESDFQIFGADLDGMREYDPDPKKLKLRVIGYSNGEGFVVVSSRTGNKLNPLFLCKVIVGKGGPAPQPPVPPDPGPGPQPNPPPPVPASVVKFLVVVEETGEAVGKRGLWFADKTLAARLKEKGVRWRCVDKDVKNADGVTPPDIERFVDAAAGKPLPRVYLVDERGRELFAGNMPNDTARLMELLSKYGG